MAEAITCYASPSESAEVRWARRFKRLVEEKGIVEGVGVRYIPNHAKGDREHPDCEDGMVSSIVERWDGGTVFVRYYRRGALQSTAQGTDPELLEVIEVELSFSLRGYWIVMLL